MIEIVLLLALGAGIAVAVGWIFIQILLYMQE
jgi:hypothetical protein